jgi:hypothetical protein
MPSQGLTADARPSVLSVQRLVQPTIDALASRFPTSRPELSRCVPTAAAAGPGLRCRRSAGIADRRGARPCHQADRRVPIRVHAGVHAPRRGITNRASI